MWARPKPSPTMPTVRLFMEPPRDSAVDSDDTRGAESQDLLGAVPELGEDPLGVLAERGGPVTEAPRSLGQIDRRRRERRRPREAGILRVLEEPGGPDVRVTHRLLGGVERRRGNLRRLERRERLGGRALGGPLRHALGDDLAVVAPRLLIL